MNKMISVIMPVYNAAKYLDEAIQSVLNQTYTNFEFLIIDDGSKDNSLEIIQSYAKNDSRIKIISRPNKGLIYSLNEALSVAMGEYIARMDADDVNLPTRFEEQLKLLTYKNADICGCHWFIINENGKYLDVETVGLNEFSIVMYLAQTVPFAHGSVMIKKEFLTSNNLKYGIGNAKYAEDYELWITMFQKNAKFVNVDNFLFKYRLFSQSLSQRNFKLNRKDAKKLGIDFLIKNKNLCMDSFNALLKSDLSSREEELLILMGLRMACIFKKLSFFTKALKKVQKKSLPSSLSKAFYIALID